MRDNIKIRVGVGSRNYGYRRVAYDLPMDKVEYVKWPYMPWKFVRPSDNRMINSYLFLPGAQIDLYHLWNGICFNRKPWITSFEAHLPRYCGCSRDWLYNAAIDRIHRPNCRALLALSDYAKNFFFLQNKDLIDDTVREKTKVFYGGVDVNVKNVEARLTEKKNLNSLTLCMVGHLFFQKGGLPLIRAFKRAMAKYPLIHLNLVSRLVIEGDYVTKTTDEERQQVINEIKASPNITWFEKLDHDQVLAIIHQSDVGVLASLDDTFGWSVVECMSQGLPVITTNVCAFPEIITPGKNGFIINVPLQENRRWHGLAFPENSIERKQALSEVYELITDNIYKIIDSIYLNYDYLSNLGLAAAMHVHDVHNIAKQAEKLGNCYRDALS